MHLKEGSVLMGPRSRLFHFAQACKSACKQTESPQQPTRLCCLIICFVFILTSLPGSHGAISTDISISPNHSLGRNNGATAPPLEGWLFSRVNHLHPYYSSPTIVFIEIMMLPWGPRRASQYLILQVDPPSQPFASLSIHAAVQQGRGVGGGGRGRV